MKQDLRKLAEAIADDLFVNGSGQRAGRLVMTIDGSPTRDLGGWSQAAMVDRIQTVLAAALPQTGPRHEEP